MNEKTFTFGETELEILIRGCRRMTKTYKGRFAVTDDPEEEAKQMLRFTKASALLKDLETALADIQAEAEENW